MFVARIVVGICFWPVLVCAKKQSDEPIVEIKCLVPKEKIAEFSRKMSLASRDPLIRVVCFFDTESLSLFRHSPKVILRSRYDSSGGTDATVKIRDGKVKADDAECELDAVIGKPRTLSCSMTDKDQTRFEIKQANAGRELKKIFTKRQEATLTQAFGRVDWQQLIPYGPVKEIKVWKNIKVTDGPDLTVERWKLPARAGHPGRTLLEVSVKVPVSQEAIVAKWMANLVGVSASASDQESETKTRIVLEHFRSAATN